jgi:hypothetical protein
MDELRIQADQFHERPDGYLCRRATSRQTARPPPGPWDSSGARVPAAILQARPFPGATDSSGLSDALFKRDVDEMSLTRDRRSQPAATPIPSDKDPRPAAGTAAKMRRPRPRECGQNTVDTLILDLLEWLGPDRRPYVEVLEAWRTSCPRLPVWETPTTEASSRVIMRLDGPRSSRCPPPGRSTCASTANRRRADGWTR